MENIKLSLFRILGFIRNYAGGLDIEKGIVQGLFEEDRPRLKIFSSYCEELLNDYGLQNDLEWIDKKSNGVLILSNNICQLIDTMFVKSKFLIHDYLKLNNDIFDPVKSLYIQEDKGLLQRRAFLEGVFCSHFIDDELRFYNDYDKAILTHRSLSYIADEEDEVEMKSYYRTPHVISIKTIGPLGTELQTKLEG